MKRHLQVKPLVRSLRPHGPGNTWTAAQWNEIQRLALVASRKERSGCAPRTAMAVLREFAEAAIGELGAGKGVA